MSNSHIWYVDLVRKIRCPSISKMYHCSALIWFAFLLWISELKESSQFDLYRFLFHSSILLYLLLHSHCTINEIMSESNSVEVQAMPTPVPMSFPAILRNSKLSDRYSYLRENETIIRDNTPSNNSVPKRKTREDKEGKRWVRRRENARFTGNPYVVFARPGSRDMQIDLPTAKKTFVSSPPFYPC